ncbi:TIGR02710 family CRISPR-associated CARF protein [Lyngbya confervoides]|uniref:TIGR02710 family CRISPR-associated CARF protein n=1 Tax=Lyngbya confervoides BDU141951 TaxID=1574623 RepID=A0ABD4T572_9CYAN|nr:TIGR02710 family CRISPR-associated CARF protein [Lyngbya confervoides]MCM1983648.1 TIGR02710 family CRISPR-associated CARF protein [Lyngbya confervoides BDU141951]
MSKVLFLTVGGSPAPLISAVNNLRPQRVVFICSDGPRGSISQVLQDGTPCEIREGTTVKDRLPNLPTHLQLGDRFHPETDVVALPDPDDLSDAYQQICAKILEVRQTTPEAELAADYTGGTKTMSLALGTAAIDHQVSLYLTSANRINLIRVDRGEATERASTLKPILQRTLHQVIPGLLEQYDYPAIASQLQDLLQTYELPKEDKVHIRMQRQIWQGFDAWDRFDHEAAWHLLAPHIRILQPHALFLKRVIGSRALIDPEFTPEEKTRGTGYELVQDLLLNAERRVKQQRYDDAVGRLYRALELFAQIHLLKEYGLRTGDVDIELLPSPLREGYESQRQSRTGKIQLALLQSYEVLGQMEAADASLGGLYRQQKEALIDALRVRNFSLFAHGFQPVGQNTYEAFSQVVVGFIQAGLQQVCAGSKGHLPLQFPQCLDLGSA